MFLFFVISGFCIHLQWAKARAAGGEPDICFGALWNGRICRLYPAYIPVLALYMLLSAATSGLNVTHSVFYWVPVPEAAASHWFTWALGAIGVEAMLGLIQLPKWSRDLRLATLLIIGASALSRDHAIVALGGPGAASAGERVSGDYTGDDRFRVGLLLVL